METSENATLAGRKLLKLMFAKETLIKSSLKGKRKGREALDSVKVDKLFGK